MWLLWNLFDLAGTLSFAVSGAIVGAVKRMDILAFPFLPS
ncbi:TRIC cation channel family protein [Acidaminococcus intestini]|nr:TRIC cation channel family protein [Acidaminococcus intestini]